MRRRTDKNQQDIVRRLRDLGFSVQVLANVGKGCPDLLIGWSNQNFLIELKSGKKWTTEDEANWIASWNGSVHVCSSLGEVLSAIVSDSLVVVNGVPLKIESLMSMLKGLTNDSDSSGD